MPSINDVSALCTCKCYYLTIPEGDIVTTTATCEKSPTAIIPSDNCPLTIVHKGEDLRLESVDCKDVPTPPAEAADPEPVKNIFFRSLDKTAENTGHLDGDADSGRTLTDMISLAISIILGLVGTIFLIFLIYGGYLWMTSLGNDQQLGRAKNIVRNSVIGLVVVVAAYAIVSIFKTII